MRVAVNSKPKEGDEDFYLHGKTEDTPVNRGKSIYALAKERR